MTDTSSRGKITVRRRVVLLGTVAVAGAAAFVTPGSPASAGGKLVAARELPVEGTGLTVRLPAGAAAEVLIYVARRFNYEIGTLHPGDLVGDPAGDAIGIRPGWYPVGATDGFLPYQLIVVRDILAQCDGLVRWGGDRVTDVAEGRFELAVAASDPKLGALAKRLGSRSARPGTGMALPFTAARIKKATALRKRMTGR